MTIVYDDEMNIAKDLSGHRGGRSRTWVLEGMILAILLVSAGVIMPYARKHYFVQSLQAKGGHVEYLLIEHPWFHELTGWQVPDLFRTVVMLDLTETHGLTDQEIQATRMFDGMNGLFLMNADVEPETVLGFANREELNQILIRNCPRIDLETILELRRRRPDMTIHFRSTAFLGVYGASVHTQECRILEIEPGSAASKAGIRHGDVIESFEGTPVIDFDHLVTLLGEKAAGDTVHMKIDRFGKKLEMDVTLGGWVD